MLEFCHHDGHEMTSELNSSTQKSTYGHLIYHSIGCRMWVMKKYKFSLCGAHLGSHLEFWNCQATGKISFIPQELLQTQQRHDCYQTLQRFHACDMRLLWFHIIVLLGICVQDTYFALWRTRRRWKQIHITAVWVARLVLDHSIAAIETSIKAYSIFFNRFLAIFSRNAQIILQFGTIVEMFYKLEAITVCAS